MRTGWFGLDSGAPLSLEYRALADLVQQLASMTFQQDKEDKNLYHFVSSKGLHIIVKIVHERGEEDYFYLVEIMDDSRKVLLSEEIYWAGFPSTLGHHPFYELIELISGRHQKELAKVKTVNELLVALLQK